jgi:hypothetical protein
MSDGSIIATIIASHITRHEPNAAAQLSPGIRIQAMDIVHPPGIRMPPIADMDVHARIVTAVVVAKSNAATPRKTRSEVSARPPLR